MTDKAICFADILSQTCSGCVAPETCDAPEFGADASLVVDYLDDVGFEGFPIYADCFSGDGFDCAGEKTDVGGGLEGVSI
jgi:hypothetical protein